MGVKISELNEATSAQNSDVLPIVQNGETKKISVETLGNLIYPVGSIYMSVNSTSPATLFGGTWEQIKGRFLLGTGGVEANTTDFWGELQENAFNCPPGERGGEAWHGLTINEMPSHNHAKITGLSGSQVLHFVSSSGNTLQQSAVITNTGNKNAAYDGEASTSYTGRGQAHNNMPPYLAVFMWKRIA